MTDTPDPSPAEQAQLDQLAAQLRDLSPADEQRLQDAARGLRAATTAGDDPYPAAAEVFAALRSAGVHSSAAPQPCPVCDGWGHDPARSGVEECPECGGTGVVR